MTRLPALLLLLVVGCSAEPPLGSVGGFRNVTGATDAGPQLADGGGTDAGVICASDTDGASGGSRVVISELFLGASPFIELRNNTPTTLVFATLGFTGTVTPLFSATSVEPGGYILGTLQASSAGELLITQDGVMKFYMCWGSLGPTSLQNEAITAGLWTTPGVCAALPPTNTKSLHLTRSGTTFGDWTAGAPTPLGCAAP